MPDLARLFSILKLPDLMYKTMSTSDDTLATASIDEATAQDSQTDEKTTDTLLDEATAKEAVPTTAFGTFELPLKVESKNEKSFRLSNRKLFLTYPGHIIKKDYIDWFTTQYGAPEFIALAHEKGSTDVSYPHTHVLIDMGVKKKLESRQCRFLDWSGNYVDPPEDLAKPFNPHPNINLVNTNLHFDNSKRYLAKEDPENAHLTLSARKQAINRIRNCKTKEEYIETMIPLTPDGLIDAKSFKPALDMYESLRPEIEIKVREPTYTFQKWFMEKFSKPCTDDRHFHWFYDPVGGSGKSTLAKYLTVTNPNQWIFSNDMTNPKDVACAIDGAMKSGWSHHGFINNLSRSTELSTGVTKVLECVKDGSIFNSKYQSKALLFNSPHVVVFANYLPPIMQASLDRWIVYQVDKIDGDSACRRVKSDGSPLIEFRTASRKDKLKQLTEARRLYKKLLLDTENALEQLEEESDTEEEDVDFFAS